MLSGIKNLFNRRTKVSEADLSFFFTKLKSLIEIKAELASVKTKFLAGLEDPHRKIDLKLKSPQTVAETVKYFDEADKSFERAIEIFRDIFVTGQTNSINAENLRDCFENISRCTNAIKKNGDTHHQLVTAAGADSKDLNLG